MKIDEKFGSAINAKQRTFLLKKYQIRYTARNAKKRTKHIMICWYTRIEISNLLKCKKSKLKSKRLNRSNNRTRFNKAVFLKTSKMQIIFNVLKINQYRRSNINNIKDRMWSKPIKSLRTRSLKVLKESFTHALNALNNNMMEIKIDVWTAHLDIDKFVRDAHTSPTAYIKESAIIAHSKICSSLLQSRILSFKLNTSWLKFSKV